MSTPMTEQQLAEIAARAEAAPKGPWYVERNEPTLTNFVTNRDGSMQVSLGYVGNRTEAEGAFITHAREDVPALLAEVERRDQRIAELQQGLDDLAGLVRSWHQKATAADERVAELKRKDDAAVLRRALGKMTELRDRLKTAGDPDRTGVTASIHLVRALADATEAGEEW